MWARLVVALATVALAAAAAPPLSLEVQPYHEQVPLEANELLVMATLRAPPLPADVARAPVDIVVVLDRSGSMDGDDKMVLAKRTIGHMVEHLTANDRFALVTFDHVVESPVPLSPMDAAGRDLVRAALDTQCSPRGGTDLQCGMVRGLDLLDPSTAAENRVCALFVLTDGRVNHGIKDHNAIIASLDRPGRNCVMHTFAYGSDHDSDLLKRLAETRGGGNYFYLQRPTDVLEAFATTLGGLVSTYARDIQVYIRPTEGAAVGAADPALRTQRDGAALLVTLPGTLMAEGTRDVLVRVALPAVTRVGAAPVLHVELVYTYAPTSERVTQSAQASVTRTAAPDKEQPPSLAIDAQLNRLEVARVLERAKELGDAGRLEEARTALREALAKLQASPSHDDPLVKRLAEEVGKALEGMRDHSAYLHNGQAFIGNTLYAAASQTVAAHRTSAQNLMFEAFTKDSP